jgi:hypothetical protein
VKRLELVDGAQVDAPSADTVRDAVGNLSASIEFVVLRETAGGFVQAAWGPSAGLPPGHFMLETAGEHVDGHVQAVVTDVDQLVRPFLGFLEDDRSWTEEHSWSRWTSEGPPQP